MIRLLKTCRALILGIAVLGLPGCGHGLTGERQPVSGTVTLDGKPLPYGFIEFSQDADKGQVQTAAVTDGKFNLPANIGLPVGRYCVCLHPYVPEADVLETVSEKERLAISAASDLIPPNYRRRGSLEATIEAGGKSDLAFALSRPK